jgi:hypothetical protein
MNLMHNDVERAISLYLDAFSWYKPSNQKSSEYVAHRLVSQLINGHLLGVYFEPELSERIKDFESIVRQIQAELDCIYLDISDMSTSKYIKGLAGLKPNPILRDYHALVVKLLKIILFCASESSNPKLALKIINDCLNTIIQVYVPTALAAPVFKDENEKEQQKNIDFDTLLKNYLDITL